MNNNIFSSLKKLLFDPAQATSVLRYMVAFLNSHICLFRFKLIKMEENLKLDYSVSLVTFPVSMSHRWLVATLLDSEEYFHH